VRLHVLEREQLVPAPLDRVFAFFAEAHNLQALTPSFLRFAFETAGPIHMRPGARIAYRLSLFGVRFRWLTEIAVWEPGRRFVDVQLEGPYRRWVHTHEFAPAACGTIVRDRVEYALPLGPAGALAHRLFVRRTLARIFDHRRDRIAALVGGDRAPAEGLQAGACGASPAPSSRTR
jgi:ligand-binding SRPBCC domain-containing protein